jgi:outer membrane lipoprotein-sorting protein
MKKVTAFCFLAGISFLFFLSSCGQVSTQSTSNDSTSNVDTTVKVDTTAKVDTVENGGSGVGDRPVK